MATLELPPRRPHKSHGLTLRRNRSSLEILLQMGFLKHRAEKALAATGDKGVQLACDWLLSHVGDPNIDVSNTREYTLYLCPLGPLQQQLISFWQKSHQELGWNGAHCYFPHITLCKFFEAEDSFVSRISHIIKRVVDRIVSPVDIIKFDYFSSSNFIGFFVIEPFTTYFKNIQNDFVEELKSSGINIEIHKMQLHISIAYHFLPERREKLENLVKSMVDITQPARWDLRLFSRNVSPNKSQQTRRVLYTHTPRDLDELELTDGDVLHVLQSDIDLSTDGWYPATSWLTGCSGLIPGAYTERTADTETWTLHRSLPVAGVNVPIGPPQVGPTQWSTDQNNTCGFSSHNLSETLHPMSRSAGINLSTIIEDNVDEESSLPPFIEDSYSPLPDIATSHSSSKVEVGKEADITSVLEMAPINSSITLDTAEMGGHSRAPRQLFIARHGERIDFTFGNNWIQQCFNHAGKYMRQDLNMPPSLPNRALSPDSFSLDSPLTLQGHTQARMLGEALLEKRVEIAFVYSSPSLRCVQTATSILKGLKLEKEMHVEPGLFEWLSWYQLKLPNFMTISELVEAGYPVNTAYDPICPIDKYNLKETIPEFYERCYQVTKEILKKHDQEGGNVLFVSHGSNLDSCTRRLIGQPVRTVLGFHEMLQRIPYLATAVAQEATVVKDTWYLTEPPVLPFTHTSNPRFNWTIITQNNF